MYVQLLCFFHNAAPVPHHFGAMNIISDLAVVVIYDADDFFPDIAAVIDFTDQLVSRIPGSDD